MERFNGTPNSGFIVNVGWFWQRIRCADGTRPKGLPVLSACTLALARTCRPRGYAPIQNDRSHLCGCNELGCLPVANCTTGAQRFLAALSNRGTHHGPHLLTRGMRPSRSGGSK
jgi:hypothetical protein